MNAGWLARKPEMISFHTAAASGVSGLVALSAIHALDLRPGMRLVIVGATRGIGGMAVQFAARVGAEVIGVRSGERRTHLRLRLFTGARLPP